MYLFIVIWGVSFLIMGLLSLVTNNNRKFETTFNLSLIFSIIFTIILSIVNYIKTKDDKIITTFNENRIEIITTINEKDNFLLEVLSLISTNDNF